MNDDAPARDPAALLPFSKEIEYAPDHKPLENPYLNDPTRPRITFAEGRYSDS